MGQRTSELKLPTMVVTVRLAIAGASPSAVEMFVPDVPRRGRAQLLDDLATQLDGAARFVPVRTNSRVRLVAKHAIAWISVERSETRGGDPDGFAGGAGGKAHRGIERSETRGGDPDGFAGGAGGKAHRGIERSETRGGDPDGLAGGAGGRVPRGIERSETRGGGPDGSAGGVGGRSPRGIERGDPDEAPAEPAEIPEDLTLFDHQHFVEVELAHGTKLIGTLLDSAPADHARVADHLNHSGRWLRLWTTDQHYLINVQQVVAVTELGEVW